MARLSRFELVDQIDVEEPAAVASRAVTAWERHCALRPHAGEQPVHKDAAY